MRLLSWNSSLFLLRSPCGYAQQLWAWPTFRSVPVRAPTANSCSRRFRIARKLLKPGPHASHCCSSLCIRHPALWQAFLPTQVCRCRARRPPPCLIIEQKPNVRTFSGSTSNGLYCRIEFKFVEHCSAKLTRSQASAFRLVVSSGRLCRCSQIVICTLEKPAARQIYVAFLDILEKFSRG